MCAASGYSGSNGGLHGRYHEYPAVELQCCGSASPVFTGVEIRHSRSDEMARHLDRQGFPELAVHDFDYEGQRLPGQCDVREFRGAAACTGFYHHQKFISNCRFQFHANREWCGKTGHDCDRSEHWYPDGQYSCRHPKSLTATRGLRGPDDQDTRGGGHQRPAGPPRPHARQSAVFGSP